MYFLRKENQKTLEKPHGAKKTAHNKLNPQKWTLIRKENRAWRHELSSLLWLMRKAVAPFDSIKKISFATAKKGSIQLTKLFLQKSPKMTNLLDVLDVVS